MFDNALIRRRVIAFYRVRSAGLTDTGDPLAPGILEAPLKISSGQVSRLVTPDPRSLPRT